jgi:hypothetical protein
MNEASTKARKDEEADGVHRLRDIVVEEVSLVDRAANQRRFLVVKRSADMADENTATADTKPDSPKAIEKAKKKPAATAAEDAADQEKAKKKPADEGDDADDTAKARASTKDDDEEEDGEDEPTKKARKQDLVLAPPVKGALLRVLTDALERLMTLANTIKEAAEPEEGGGGEMPEDVSAELEAIADLLWGAKKSKRTKADVAKAGARMAKDRLDRFQKALSLLADILKELTDTKEAPPAPTAGAAESGVTKRDAATPKPAAVPGLEDLVSGIDELTRVVKRQEEELARMRQARGVSNAIPVEGGRRAEHQDVSWPLDMNRPISRDKVRKEVSFFDE